MFAGHYSSAFVAKASHPRVPIWCLLAAAQFVDILWGLFVLTGVEHVRMAPELPSTPLDLYHMPYTHSLVGALFWSVVAFLGARRFLSLDRRQRLRHRRHGRFALGARLARAPTRLDDRVRHAKVRARALELSDRFVPSRGRVHRGERGVLHPCLRIHGAAPAAVAAACGRLDRSTNGDCLRAAADVGREHDRLGAAPLPRDPVDRCLGGTKLGCARRLGSQEREQVRVQLFLVRVGDAVRRARDRLSSVAPFTSLADARPAAPIGTI